MKMVVARAAGTVMASSLNQNKFWTKYCCDGGIKPAPSPLGRWRKNDTIIRCLDGIFIEIFCVWGNGLDPFPHLEFRTRGRSATITGNNNRIIVWDAEFGTCTHPPGPWAPGGALLKARFNRGGSSIVPPHPELTLHPLEDWDQ